MNEHTPGEAIIGACPLTGGKHHWTLVEIRRETIYVGDGMYHHEPLEPPVSDWICPCGLTKEVAVRKETDAAIVEAEATDAR